MIDYDMNIHTNPDARAWAKFFRETNPNCNVSDDTMIGWFANAMMAMHDHLVLKGNPINGDHAQYLIDKAKECGYIELGKFAAADADKIRDETNERANASWGLMCKKMVAIEREACAKLCEQSDRYRGEYFASKIRERGDL